MPGTPINVTGPFTVKIGNQTVLTVGQNEQAVFPAGSVRTGDESYSIPGGTEITSSQGTTQIPSEAQAAGPGLGLPV